MEEQNDDLHQSSTSANNIIFPPLQAKFAVPPGAFLVPKNQSLDGGKPYICKSGFENLASSSQFVKCIREDTDKLLSKFVREWKQYSEAADKPNGKRRATESTESPFQMFKQIFVEQGWHLAQLFWSENDATRLAMYIATIRIFAEPLQALSSFVSGHDDIQSQPDHDTLLQACGCVFAMYLLQTTTILEERYRHTPGYGVRLLLEADLLLILNKLPDLSFQILQEPVDEDGLRPIDDLIFILRELQAPSDLGPHESTQGSTVDVLLPLQYKARPALITTTFTTKSEVDKEGGEYGSIRNLQMNSTQNLNRIEMAHVLVRKAVGMPLLSMKSTDQNNSFSAMNNKYLQHNVDADIEYQPSTRQRPSTHWRSTHYVGAPNTAQQDKFTSYLEEMDRVQQIYHDQVRAVLGNEGIIGAIDSNRGPEDDNNDLKKKIMSRAKLRTRKKIAQKFQSVTQTGPQK